MPPSTTAPVRTATPAADTMTVSEAFYDVLRQQGVKAIFGNPGSNELTFLQGLPSELPYYLALNEGAAVAMADGFAKASGTPGFVSLHAAAGTGNGMGALTNAADGHTPLVVLSGQQARRYVPVDALLTNVDAIKLCEPLVKWAGEPLRPEDGPALGSKALMLAQTAPTGPVYLSIPLDDWRKPADAHAVEQLLARSISGGPAADESALAALVAALDHASSPVMVLGPGADTEDAFPAAIALAEKAQLPVWIGPSPARWPFATRHPNYQGELPSAAGDVADILAGHDVVVCFGAPIFRYHAPSDGDFLASGTVLFGVTDDPDEAARAPVGHLIVGDPSNALIRVSEKAAKSDRGTPTPRTVEVADPAGPPYGVAAIVEAIDRGKTDETIIVLEWTSSDPVRDRFTITRAKSLYIPAAGGLGWGLPAAIGVQLAEPDRRVLGILGDGAMQYTTSGLWTAARHNVPVTFIVCTNTKYRALEEFSEVLHVPDAEYLDIPQIDILKAAEAYGIPAVRVDTLDELSETVSRSNEATGPRLVEVLER